MEMSHNSFTDFVHPDSLPLLNWLYAQPFVYALISPTFERLAIVQADMLCLNGKATQFKSLATQLFGGARSVCAKETRDTIVKHRKYLLTPSQCAELRALAAPATEEELGE